MKHILMWSILALFLNSCASKSESPYNFNIQIDPSLSDEAQSGRLLLMLSTDDSSEPRFQISDGPQTQIVFGMDITEVVPGEDIPLSGDIFGYPYASLNDLPEGTYQVQALLNRYEMFNLSTGHNVLLPPEKGEGQQWNRKPGNYYNEPATLNISSGGTYEIVMDQKIDEIEPPADTDYIKHVKMKSEMLSEFWGRDVYLGANVLIPHGFNEHPEAKYPLMIFHGHFPNTFRGFREDPPDPDLEPDFSERFNISGYNIMVQQEAHDLYKKWISDDFPRFLVIEIQHANPYYDDSYAVNSENLGPYGDAITYELIPYVEELFRGQGESWSRFLYGGSTGGWEALAVQVKYPDEYNGCFAACPDPIDFAAYCLVNIYEDKNAYYYPGEHRKVERPGKRDYLGNVTASLRSMNHRELALGTKSRSGQQWDIWEAVYSPMGPEGYPQRLWDKKSGDINHEVAEYWKENHDLRYILERDWETIGPKLEGKIHIYCGDMDNYYLNNAVYLMEEFLESTENPYYNGEVAYGDRAEHCWNGDPNLPNHITRLRYNTMYLPKILERIKESAPRGADLTSWRY
ncbi:MAG: hypothetical protein HKN68_18515 [Saprospiraceae bacterium]|nr:hypothetical protein [Saprospiraceae bacterium]